jgi:hypothetical protein
MHPPTPRRYFPPMRNLFLLALVTFASTAAVNAQWVAAYGNLAITPVHNSELYPYNSQLYTSFTPVGVNVGATLNFINFAPFAAGLDASETYATTADFWLAGFRIMAKPHVLRVKPSFKLAVGKAHLHPSGTSYTGPGTGNQAIDYQVYIYNAALAIDYKITRFIDARVEVGDGRTLGAGSANPTNLLTINTGLVAHF